MGETVRRTVVVSAVNIRKGGTLRILQDCLDYLCGLGGEYRIIALVHRRDMFSQQGIEFIELPWTTKSWLLRLWAEYVTMHRISKRIAANSGGHKVWMWLSLHDSTPRVEAEHQEVYCHTAFPFMKARLRDFAMDPKIALFTFLTKWVYRINIRRNDCIIVQQNWFADAMSRMLGVPREKFRVIPPEAAKIQVASANDHPAASNAFPTFFYASTPDCHKNFETLCQAARLLESSTGTDKFKLILTVKGDENRYAKWLYKRYHDCSCIDFHGFMTREELIAAYRSADCFVFPSRIESWGLPISEFISYNPDGHMLLADLPYAHESSAGGDASHIEFFDPDDAKALASLMKRIAATL